MASMASSGSTRLKSAVALSRLARAWVSSALTMFSSSVTLLSSSLAKICPALTVSPTSTMTASMASPPLFAPTFAKVLPTMTPSADKNCVIGVVMGLMVSTAMTGLLSWVVGLCLFCLVGVWDLVSGLASHLPSAKPSTKNSPAQTAKVSHWGFAVGFFMVVKWLL